MGRRRLSARDKLVCRLGATSESALWPVCHCAAQQPADKLASLPSGNSGWPERPGRKTHTHIHTDGSQSAQIVRRNALRVPMRRLGAGTLCELASHPASLASHGSRFQCASAAASAVVVVVAAVPAATKITMTFQTTSQASQRALQLGLLYP